jgi:hypothetical protein
MAKRIVFLPTLAVLVLAGSGCSYRAWYQGFQDRQRQDCYHLGGQHEIQDCLDRVDSMTYDDYQRLRQERRAGSL